MFRKVTLRLTNFKGQGDSHYFTAIGLFRSGLEGSGVTYFLIGRLLARVFGVWVSFPPRNRGFFNCVSLGGSLGRGFWANFRVLGPHLGGSPGFTFFLGSGPRLGFPSTKGCFFPRGNFWLGRPGNFPGGISPRVRGTFWEFIGSVSLRKRGARGFFLAKNPARPGVLKVGGPKGGVPFNPPETGVFG